MVLCACAYALQPEKKMKNLNEKGIFRRSLIAYIRR